MLKRLATAFSFLTIFHLPGISRAETKSEDLAGSFAFFPLVGFFLGLCWLVLAYYLSAWVPPLLLAVILTAIMAIATRALHLDGLADLADGIGGGYTAERRLEIMKDSRTGAFGALALTLAVFLKTAAIQSIILRRSWAPLLVAPMLSRLAMVLASYKSTYARKEGGLGKPFLEHLTGREVLIASLFSLICSLALTRLTCFLYLALALIVASSMRVLSRGWIGGITGDALGAVNEVAEIALLAAAAIAAANGW
jgi:adenosylcobinamide-GDP ribazoletransferase